MTPKVIRDAANGPWEAMTGSEMFLGVQVCCCLFCGWPHTTRMDAVACEARDQEQVGHVRKLFEQYITIL